MQSVKRKVSGTTNRKKEEIIIIINDLQAIQARQVVKDPVGQLPNVIVLQETAKRGKVGVFLWAFLIFGDKAVLSLLYFNNG